MEYLSKDFFRPISNNATYFYPYGRLSNQAKVIYGKENCLRLTQRIRELCLASLIIGLGYYLLVYEWQIVTLPRGLRFVDLGGLGMFFGALYSFLYSSIQGDLHSRGMGMRSIILRHAVELNLPSLALRLGFSLGLGASALGYYVMLLLNYPNGVDTFLTGMMCFMIMTVCALLSFVYLASIIEISEKKENIFK